MEDAKKTTTASPGTTNSGIKEDLQKMKQEKALEHSSAAQIKAKQTLQERARKRRVLMKQDSVVRESGAVAEADGEASLSRR